MTRIEVGYWPLPYTCKFCGEKGHPKKLCVRRCKEREETQLHKELDWMRHVVARAPEIDQFHVVTHKFSPCKEKAQTLAPRRVAVWKILLEEVGNWKRRLSPTLICKRMNGRWVGPLSNTQRIPRVQACQTPIAISKPTSLKGINLNPSSVVRSKTPTTYGCSADETGISKHLICDKTRRAMILAIWRPLCTSQIRRIKIWWSRVIRLGNFLYQGLVHERESWPQNYGELWFW